MKDETIPIESFEEEHARDSGTREPDAIAAMLATLRRTIEEQRREINRLNLLIEGEDPKRAMERRSLASFELGTVIRFNDLQPLVSLKWGPQIADLMPEDVVAHAYSLLQVACLATLETSLYQFFLQISHGNQSIASAILADFRAHRQTHASEGNRNND